MPNYDYKCKECGHEAVMSHSFKVKPEFACPDCENLMVKVFKSINFSVRNNIVAQRIKDQYVRESDMRQDLRENHCVENLTPMASGTVEQAYREIKDSGNSVRDKMQEQIAQNETESRKKQKEWQIGANKRVKARTLEKRQREAEQAARKRKITLSTNN